jgi:uncharacterized protein YecE (DUF72 family)
MTTVYIGTSGYGYKAWKGKFYPEKIRPEEMLSFYATHFKTVEINNTFYHHPSQGVVSAWADQVPEDFIFVFKAPQVITHFKGLKNVEDEVGTLFHVLSGLGKRLGPVLFQLPKSFRYDYPVLEAFLKLIPSPLACAFEFRNPSWFNPEVSDLLSRRGLSLCLADMDEKPLKEIRATSSWGYLRMRRSDYTDQDLALWAERIRSQAWDRCFVFFKHEEEAKGPQTARRFQEILASGSGEVQKATEEAVPEKRPPLTRPNRP